MPGTTVDAGAPSTRNLLLLTRHAECLSRLLSTKPDGAELRHLSTLSADTFPESDAPALLLLDCNSLSWSETLALLEKAQTQAPLLSAALLNVDARQDVRRALKWPVLHGIFTTEQHDALLTKGLNELRASRFWFSRDQMNLLASFREKPKAQSTKPTEALSPRETEVLNLTAQGKSNADIARELFLSEHTVKTHLYNLYRKLGVANRTQAVHWYQENR